VLLVVVHSKCLGLTPETAPFRSLQATRAVIDRAPQTASRDPMAVLEEYRFGRATVDGQEHTRDLIVLPDRVVAIGGGARAAR
jgi:hypothetical protein